jgi:hypothetical protein
VRAIFSHRPAPLSSRDVFANLADRLVVFRRLNEELRRELENALAEERRAGLAPLLSSTVLHRDADAILKNLREVPSPAKGAPGIAGR